MEMERNPHRVPSIIIIHDYFQWLCDIIRVNTTDDSYYFLAKVLYEKDYYWFVPNDNNRGMDGLKIREEYFVQSEWNLPNELLERPCTMLEMLIGLARRASYMMAEPGETDQTERWFWEILENIGLDKYSDSYFYRLHGTARVNRTLDILLERTYKRNGQGGLFPLKHSKKDQRKVEIWYQMCSYLDENYYFDAGRE